MLFNKLVEYSQKIKVVSSRNEKVAIIVEFLKDLNLEEAEIGVNFIFGRIKQGKLNLAWRGMSALSNIRTRSKEKPDLIEIDRYLEQTKAARGREKLNVLAPLFRRLNHTERKFLVSLILGELQQGAGEGLLKLAIVRFFDMNEGDLEQAYLRQPDIAKLFVYLRKKGKSALKDVGIKIFSPVKPMLAEIAESIDDVFEEYDKFAVEYKLDGIRIQVHRRDEDVRIFSRHLKDITPHFPELVSVAKKLPVREYIIDGEAIGIDDRGRPLPFQILAKRTTRKKDIDKMQKSIPVLPQFFDILYMNGDDLTSAIYLERIKILEDIIKDKNYLARRKLPTDKNDATQFFEHSMKFGNEGIMIKLLETPYRPGKRGKFWFKIKCAHTIDCVILAAEWGHGRRTGWLSNLHLGVLDETRTKFLMVGKTFKGLTDKMLVWLTDNLKKFKVHADAWTLYVKPEIVVEIAFNEVQKSPKYDSGFALRFARVKRIRDDKKPVEINTILDLEKILKIGHE